MTTEATTEAPEKPAITEPFIPPVVLECQALRQSAELMRRQLHAIEVALDDPRADITHTVPQLIREMKAELAELRARKQATP
jgi:hypothetical protein